MKLKELKAKLKLPIETMSERLVAIYLELLRDSRKKTKKLKQLIKSQKETK